MGLNLIKIIIILFLVSCNQTDHHIPDLLENYYANIVINNSVNKKLIIEQLKKIDIKEDNISNVKVILNQLNDGHVYLQKLNENNFPYATDLEFIPGTQFIKHCTKSCNPSLIGKYKILKIDNHITADYYELKKNDVFASTSQGRYHRVFQRLQQSNLPISHELILLDSYGKLIKTKLVNTNDFKATKKCVSGFRISDKMFKININSLWCDLDGGDSDDKSIYNNFYKEWNDVISNIRESDHIILDLRENNGGGDHEVMLVLNTFIEHVVELYKYQYLKKSIASKKELFLSMLHPSLNVWSEKNVEYTDLKYRPNKFLFNNKVTTLISAGCFSSCEGLAGNLKVHRRSQLIGNVTHGGAGEPRLYKIKNLPYRINLPACITWLPDDSLIEGKGITPNIEFRDSFNSKNDELLEFAQKN